MFRKSNNIDIHIDFKYYEPVNDPRDLEESRKCSFLSTLWYLLKFIIAYFELHMLNMQINSYTFILNIIQTFLTVFQH